jgi:primosomal protein N' (replication factor Y) (superfamily II helicase)
VAILFIHARRGLFQLTKCQTCGYKFVCENCDANLTTYRMFETNMQLICNQCQSAYSYPKSCPSCHSSDLSSKFGGIEDLVETISKEYDMEVTNLVSSKKSIVNIDKGKVYATTRIFDPSLDYSDFEKIVFVRAENLLAAPDYLVTEDIHNSITQLILSCSSNIEVIFDTSDPESSFFKEISQLNSSSEKQVSAIEWFSKFVQNERQNRQKFRFPPFQNLLLLTSQNKNRLKSQQQINTARQYLFSRKSEFAEIEIGSVYQAKFLRRKGMFSYHLLVRYPKQYKQFFSLQQTINFVANSNGLQVRLNPRHLF